MLEQLALLSSRASSQQRDQKPVKPLAAPAGEFFTTEPPESPLDFYTQLIQNQDLNV